MFLGLALSNWMIWIVMILFIVAYFLVAEGMNKREDEERDRRRGV